MDVEKIPDAGVRTALREDIADYPDKPGRLNMKGKLAESWETDPDSQWIRFNLHAGVKSNWGNELTADDVVGGLAPQAGARAIGGSFANTVSLKRKEQVKTESGYVVSFNFDNCNPLLPQAGAVGIAQYLQPLELVWLKTASSVAVATSPAAVKYRF